MNYCKQNGVATASDIDIETFKLYAAYRASATTLTKRKEIGILREFLEYLNERDLLEPKVATKLDSLLPKVRKTGEDSTANPHNCTRLEIDSSGA